MKPGNDLPVAGLCLSARCVSWCVSNVCDPKLDLLGSERPALAG